MWRLGPTRTAATLTAAALTIPCIAWYIAGSRDARQQARRIEQAPLERAGREAARLASLLSLRLESLRDSEARRPYSDYLDDVEQTLGDCSNELRLISPLAQGPSDPLIWTHFQLDDVGRLSMPTLEAGAGGSTTQQSILEELECVTATQLAARRPVGAQHVAHVVSSPGGVVTVGPFSWRTTPVMEQPALVALREVATPGAVLTQGFVVLSEALEALVADSELTAHVLPGAPIDDGEALVPLSEEPWKVSVDFTAATAAARGEARALVSRFRRTFLLGALGVLLAGISIVVVVHHTDRLSRQRARFAASAAHELRTPLAGMQLYGEMLAESMGDPRRRTEYAQRIAGEAERLGRVVDNVLGFSKLQREGIRVDPQPGDLSSATRESIDRLRPVVEAHGARVESAIESDLPASFDRDALHQILQNLLDNAEKYSRDTSDRTIRVVLAGGERGTVLSVVDAGGGVDPSIRDKLFRPFARHPDPRAPAGLGVGLALVQALAQAQGARVTHADAAGGGSIFSVHFPALA